MCAQINFIPACDDLSASDNLCRTNRIYGLTWIQTVLHSDGIPERIILKVNFEKKSAEDINL